MVSGIATGLLVVGAIFVVILIWWIEGRIVHRRAIQLAEGGPASATLPASVAPNGAPQVEPDVVSTRSAFAAAGPALAEAAAAESEPSPAAGSAASFSLPLVDAEPEAIGSNGPTVAPEPATEPGPPPEPAPVAESSPDAVAADLVAADLEPIVAAPEPEPATADGPPHLTIRVATRGMITAEMDGETEHVILDDLEAYGSALAKVDGTAVIVAATDNSMADLIARRAQRILEEAGVQVTVG